jgi:atypical dual specificity phosphatase
MSRSATVICAYFIATAKMTPDEAIAAVRANRGIVCPNLGFRRQLGQYANQLHGGRSGPGAHLAKIGGEAAEAIRKLTGRVQEEPHMGSISSTSTSTISDLASAPSR